MEPKKSPNWKGKSSYKPLFSGSMLIFRGKTYIFHKNQLNPRYKAAYFPCKKRGKLRFPLKKKNGKEHRTTAGPGTMRRLQARFCKGKERRYLNRH